jgi:hypothetical protein
MSKGDGLGGAKLKERKCSLMDAVSVELVGKGLSLRCNFQVD